MLYRSLAVGSRIEEGAPRDAEDQLDLWVVLRQVLLGLVKEAFEELLVLHEEKRHGGTNLLNDGGSNLTHFALGTTH